MPANTAGQDSLGVTCGAAPEASVLEPQWRALEAESDAHYFTSWGWIGTWLTLLPAAAKPLLISLSDGGRTVALGLMCRKRVVRHGFIPARALALHAAADPALDCLTIEYNGLLAARGFEERAASAALSFLIRADSGWDEIVLDGVGPDYQRIAAEVGLSVQLHDRKPIFEADLAAIRAHGGDYLARLSRNTRQQVRRSIRLYEERAPLAFAVARTLDEALADYATLKSLHQRYWTERGERGAFAASFFERFHEALIRTRFAAGEIQIGRMTVGDRVAGCLYSFLWRGHVYFYQSGFDYEADSRLKPGLVAHSLAIQHNLAAGARVYDFLAGESQYKRSLGEERGGLVWLRARRPRLAYRVEDALRSAKRMITRGPRAPAHE